MGYFLYFYIGTIIFLFVGIYLGRIIEQNAQRKKCLVVHSGLLADTLQKILDPKKRQWRVIRWGQVVVGMRFDDIFVIENPGTTIEERKRNNTWYECALKCRIPLNGTITSIY